MLLLSLCAGAFAQKSAPQTAVAEVVTTVRFYPNPASSTLTFEFKAQTERGIVLQVFSFLGKQVISLPVTGNRITVNVSDLMKGIYVFQIRTSNGRVLETNKFQISR